MKCIFKTRKTWLPLRFLAMGMMLMGWPVQAEALDVRVHEAPVRTVLAGLARSAGINLVIDDTVDGTVTMELHDVPAEEAIRVLAGSQNLLYRTDGAIAFITAGRAHDQARSCYTWKLHHADPDSVRQAAETVAGSGHIGYHSDTNALILHGSAQTATPVDRLVQSLDVPVRQVGVEIEFLSLQTDAVKDLGISWDWTAMEGGPGHQAFLYTGQLRALESKGKARVLARPHLMAQNGREAQILIGDRIPVLTEHVTDGEVSRTTEYEDAGIKLSFTPRIHEDGSVTAHIRAEVGTPILVPELKAYRITTRRADTDVCMQPGRDLLIGGLISREEINNLRKVPILADIPVLGKLSRYHYTSKKETELVILIRSRAASSSPESVR